jgi:YebC/PmpR family DNA-binding regulatory protein
MSGHSKWAKIKRAKGATDQKRGALFTKLARAITMAAQEAGGDPDMNFTLRLAIDKAKQANMPLDNIERSIKKGTGELQGESVQKVTYEAITPYGVSMLIDCSTDNTNRTVSDLRNFIEKRGAKLGAAGSVAWQFKEFGQLEVGAAKLKKSTKYGEADSYETVAADELEGDLLDAAGAQDYQIANPSDDPDFEPTDQIPAGRQVAELLVDKASLKEAGESLANKGWQVISSEVIKKPDSTVNLSDADSEKLQELIAAIEELDDVDSVWTNAN